MHYRTVLDTLLDAGTSVGNAAVTAADAGFDALAVGTLLVLATARAPLLGVLLLGYVVVAAREPETPLSAFEDWHVIGLVGIRATGLVAAVCLPAAAVLIGSGLVASGGPESFAGLEFASAELFAILGAASLAVAAWHCAVVGLVALAVGAHGAFDTWLRLCRSPAGYRLSIALAGVAVSVPVVAFGLTAIPVFGSVLAAGAIFFGLAVAARLLSGVVADETSQRDRLATAVDSGAGGYRGGGGTRRIDSDAPDRGE